MGSAEFVDYLRSLLDIGDRQIRLENYSRLGDTYADVYVNFINLPEGIGGAGGGAEAENNRTSFWIYGFDKSDPHASAPRGKVKVVLSNTTLPREHRLRAKTAPPEKIAQYLANFLNKVVREVEPRFTHTRMG